MKTNINGIETSNSLTVAQFVERMKQKGEFERSADGFKTNIKREEETQPTANDLLNELALNPSSPSFFQNTKPIKERLYFNYAFARKLITDDLNDRWLKELWGGE